MLNGTLTRHDIMFISIKTIYRKRKKVPRPGGLDNVMYTDKNKFVISLCNSLPNLTLQWPTIVA